MKFWRPHSLLRRLAWRLVLLHTITLSVASALLTILILQLNPGEQIVDSSLAEAVAAAMQRGPDGELVLGPNADIERYRKEPPTVWMIVTDDQGHSFEDGPVPAAYSEMASILNRLWFVDIRDLGGQNDLAASFHSEEMLIGKLYVLAGGGAFVSTSCRWANRWSRTTRRSPSRRPWRGVFPRRAAGRHCGEVISARRAKLAQSQH